MSNAAKITEALKELDPHNENHWTSDGFPRMDTVKLLAALPSLTREEITAAAPGFSRASAMKGNFQRTAEPGPQAAQHAEPAHPTQGNGSVPIAAPVAQQPEPQGENGDDENAGAPNTAPKSKFEQAQEQLKIAQRELDFLEAERAEATKAHKAQSDKVDRLIKACEELAPASTLQDAIQGHLKRQKLDLQERADRIAALKNVNLAEILEPTMSKIDLAMSRRRGYGNNRPMYPVKK